MNGWSIWLALSPALYFAATSHLKGRAKARALWAYFWLVAGFVAYSTWHFYVTWQTLAMRIRAAGGAPRPWADVQNTWALRAGVIETIVLLLLPVVWYYRDLRKERIKG